ncbi:TVP38/TMEM64 family protein [Oceanobacillus chungangensis]|uniref:TVP38/TMEM64 family membrane protein n=1 Tax=Oceanobacillus chungangensis TaxID=1229152 RepID=A0A3D8Q195_9BACI|nr:VTT domain-containing protein [Oceanobacillus chungangensis]RDW21607.1 alkaline phosphatase [Oceanobacillus chungangensis]
MELFGNYIMAVIETGGYFAPFLFIMIHLLRPLLFLPVVFICISGGILFGPVYGSIYSFIGMTLSCLIFYRLAHWNPKSFEKLLHVKQKLLGKYTKLTVSQVTILRLIPFIHFHLLSLCLIEISENSKEYTKSSILSTIPLAVIYTCIGGWLSNLTPLSIFIFLALLLLIIYVLRRKELIIKWHEFFHVTN